MKDYFVGITRDSLPPFDRNFLHSENVATVIGEGELGGKARGLAFIHGQLKSEFPHHRFTDFVVDVPRFTVLATQVFDRFMMLNGLDEKVSGGDLDDKRIAHHVNLADLPPEILGDLRTLVEQVHAPLAVRSSSLLEDSLESPFAGMYATKMIPNHQSSIEVRFQRLAEAVKLVFASTFFAHPRDYMASINRNPREEKMAVIVQEVVGVPHGRRFYPDISGVGRSINFYPSGRARPEEGAIDLALGLGKTIVDGGRSWSYSPAHPTAPPPFGSVNERMKYTQTEFWAVNLEENIAYDPLKEEEYLVRLGLDAAEYDNTLRLTASTFDAASDRLVPGIGVRGPRVIDFAPTLDVGLLPLNEIVRSVLDLCERVVGVPVEIEFAVALPREREKKRRFGLLQVRPIGLSQAVVDIAPDEASGSGAVILSDAVLGNGVLEGVRDIVFVEPASFDFKHSPKIAREIEWFNRRMLAEGTPYVLIGFGRWGSTDHWLGIPVNWGQISGSRVIVEVVPPQRQVDFSQGSHFFHNLTNLGGLYFSVDEASGRSRIDWDWLAAQPEISRKEYVRHVRTESPLRVKVDGRAQKGVILK